MLWYNGGNEGSRPRVCCMIAGGEDFEVGGKSEGRSWHLAAAAERPGLAVWLLEEAQAATPACASAVV